MAALFQVGGTSSECFRILGINQNKYYQSKISSGGWGLLITRLLNCLNSLYWGNPGPANANVDSVK